ncbi:MAG: tRNA lysidine(34) synthetase TilS [Candidatus Neomarinimicrobiota bacterium]
MKILLSKTDLFFEKFKKEINSFSELCNNDKIIVSVSGGLDSTALLLLLHHLSCFQLVVAHINHNLRNQSNNDEEYVKNLCKELKIPFFVKSLNPLKRDKKQSVEEWGRNERYDFLNKLLEKTKFKWIMTAHHANDQVETLLMNLSRQSGIAGLRGIAKQREKIIRPLLIFTKDEIRFFAKKNKFPFCEDLSNLDINKTRNFIRQKVLFPWEKSMPRVVQNISNSVNYFKEWNDGLDFLLRRFIVPELNVFNEKIEIPKTLLEDLPNIVIVRLIQILSKSDNDQWSKHKIMMLVQFIAKSNVGKFHIIENGWSILKDRKTLIMVRKHYHLENNPVKVLIDTPILINGFRYEINLTDKKIYKIADKNHENIDWEKIKDSYLELRQWKEGDRFQPLGMNGHQKLSDFFINEKLDCIEKINQYVLTSDNEIIWICGKRISNNVRLTSNTKQVAVLSMNQI